MVILAAALGIGAAAFIFFGKAPKENVHLLSSVSSFGITNLDEVVSAMRQALKSRADIGIDLNLKGEYMDDISPMVKELMELAFEYTGRSDEGDYIRYQVGGYEFSYGHEKRGDGYIYSIVIKPNYYDSKEQEQETDEKIREILSSGEISAAASDYEKIRAVYDYIALNVKYDAVHKKNDHYGLKNTAFGALVNKTAVCQGYAVAMYRLLLELGIENHIITGVGITASSGEEHAWNLVLLDGKYYYIDPTWNYTVREEDYFLKGSEDFKDHVPDQGFEEMYGVSDYSYYR